MRKLDQVHASVGGDVHDPDSVPHKLDVRECPRDCPDRSGDEDPCEVEFPEGLRESMRFLVAVADERGTGGLEVLERGGLCQINHPRREGCQSGGPPEARMVRYTTGPAKAPMAKSGAPPTGAPLTYSGSWGANCIRLPFLPTGRGRREATLWATGGHRLVGGRGRQGSFETGTSVWQRVDRQATSVGRTASFGSAQQTIRLQHYLDPVASRPVPTGPQCSGSPPALSRTPPAGARASPVALSRVSGDGAGWDALRGQSLQIRPHALGALALP